MKVNAYYFDGLSAGKKELSLSILPQGLMFPDGEIWLYDDLKLINDDAKNGQIIYEHKNKLDPSITLLLPAKEKDPVRDFLGRISKKLINESKWHFVRWQIVSTAAILSLLFIFYLIYPYINRSIVNVVPDSWIIKTGDLVVDQLYQQYSTKVCRSPEGIEALNKLMKKIKIDNLPYPLRVEVVNTPIINAMAAPGGRIIIFNGLIQAAESSDEVIGVLGHEIGHVYYKHPMQSLVNILGLSFIGSFLGGDGATIAIAGLSMSYSRDLERDADIKALEILDENNISVEGLINFFERAKEKSGQSGNEGLDVLYQTHPLNEERISYMTEHLKNNPTELQKTKFIEENDWNAILKICE